MCMVRRAELGSLDMRGHKSHVTISQYSTACMCAWLKSARDFLGNGGLHSCDLRCLLTTHSSSVV